MSIQHHRLKTEKHYYQAVELGIKTFELRRNDRNFQVGDIVTLYETLSGVETGRELPPKEIKYILYGGSFALPETHCILQLSSSINEERPLKKQVVLCPKCDGEGAVPHIIGTSTSTTQICPTCFGTKVFIV